MTQEDIKEKVNTFLVEEMEIEESKIRDDANITKDVGVDSLDYVDIVAFILKTFNFRVESGDFKKIQTLSDLYKYIEIKSQFKIR